MADEAPVSDVLCEAMEYLCKLGNNLKSRSESLKEKRVNHQKLKNTHAVQKAASKLLLICELSKKSIENVENGVKKILSRVDISQKSLKNGANDSTIDARKRSEDESESKYQYFRYGSNKIKVKVRKKISLKHFVSVKVKAKPMPRSMQDKYPVYYNCKLYRLRKRKSFENRETHNSFAEIETLVDSENISNKELHKEVNEDSCNIHKSNQNIEMEHEELETDRLPNTESESDKTKNYNIKKDNKDSRDNSPSSKRDSVSDEKNMNLCDTSEKINFDEKLRQTEDESRHKNKNENRQSKKFKHILVADDSSENSDKEKTEELTTQDIHDYSSPIIDDLNRKESENDICSEKDADKIKLCNNTNKIQSLNESELDIVHPNTPMAENSKKTPQNTESSETNTPKCTDENIDELTKSGGDSMDGEVQQSINSKNKKVKRNPIKSKQEKLLSCNIRDGKDGSESCNQEITEKIIKRNDNGSDEVSFSAKDCIAAECKETECSNEKSESSCANNFEDVLENKLESNSNIRNNDSEGNNEKSSEKTEEINKKKKTERKLSVRKRSSSSHSEESYKNDFTLTYSNDEVTCLDNDKSESIEQVASTQKEVAIEDDSSRDSLTKKPMIKCVSLDKLLKPDILKNKKSQSLNTDKVFPRKQDKVSKKIEDIKKYDSNKSMKSIKTIEKQNSFWEQKRKEVQAFKPKDFVINVISLPKFTISFLQKHNLKRIIQNGSVKFKINHREDDIVCNLSGSQFSNKKMNTSKNNMPSADEDPVKSSLLNDSDSDKSTVINKNVSETEDVRNALLNDSESENNGKIDKDNDKMVNSDPEKEIISVENGSENDKKSSGEDSRKAIMSVEKPDTHEKHNETCDKETLLLSEEVDNVKLSLLNDSPGEVLTTPSKKHRHSGTPPSQSKRKHIMESMHAKRMLLTYSSSSETEDEQLRNALKEIKDSLLPGNSSSDEGVDVKKQVIKSYNKRLLSSSDSDDNSKQRNKKRKKLQSESPLLEQDNNDDDVDSKQSEKATMSRIDQVDGNMDEESDSISNKVRNEK